MNSKIKYALAIILAGVSSQIWAACDVQSNSSIVATANGDSCTNSSAISTTTNDAFGMDAGSLTSVPLTNASAGTIVTTGDGAAGIHSIGDDAIFSIMVLLRYRALVLVAGIMRMVLMH